MGRTKLLRNDFLRGGGGLEKQTIRAGDQKRGGEPLQADPAPHGRPSNWESQHLEGEDLKVSLAGATHLRAGGLSPATTGREGRARGNHQHHCGGGGGVSQPFHFPLVWSATPQQLQLQASLSTPHPHPRARCCQEKNPQAPGPRRKLRFLLYMAAWLRSQGPRVTSEHCQDPTQRHLSRRPNMGICLAGGAETWPRQHTHGRSGKALQMEGAEPPPPPAPRLDRSPLPELEGCGQSQSQIS